MGQERRPEASWLRRGRPVTTGQVKFPTVFPWVRGKCFGVTGHRTCEKRGHSCVRRVVDCAGAPSAIGVAIGRGRPRAGVNGADVRLVLCPL